MKTLFLSLTVFALALPGISQACSVADDYEYRLKNDLISQFLGDYTINAQIDKISSLTVDGYKGELFYTFPDRGADCPDSVALKGTITSTFARPSRYNREKADAAYRRFEAGEITNEELNAILAAEEICSVKAAVESKKIPQKRGAASYYRTTLTVIDALSCSK